MSKTRPQRRILDITQEDIDEGIPNDPKHCTVALASARCFQDAEKLKIVSGNLEIFFDDEIWRYKLPKMISCIPTLIDLGERAAAFPTQCTLERPAIYKRKKSETKTVSVKNHLRAAPGEGEVNDSEKLTSRQKGAKMRAHLHSMGLGTRFAGNEV